MGIYLFFGRRFLVFLPPDLGDPFVFGNIDFKNPLNEPPFFLVDLLLVDLLSVDLLVSIGGNTTLFPDIGLESLGNIWLYEFELWSSLVDLLWCVGSNPDVSCFSVVFLDVDI